MTDTAEPADEREFTLVVDRVKTLAVGVVGLTLRHPSGEELPEWAPGAHIDLVLREGLTRQYSLCGNPADHTSYRVAVLREPRARAGSAFVHDELTAGDKVAIRGPRNHFPLHEAPSYLFIAGGIGIAPILPMIAAVEAAGASWVLAYGGRQAASMAFRSDLQAYGERVSICPQDVHGFLDLPRLLDDVTPGTLVYCCGPEGLLHAVEERCGTLPKGTLHVERFAPGRRPVSRGSRGGRWTGRGGAASTWPWTRSAGSAPG